MNSKQSAGWCVDRSFAHGSCIEGATHMTGLGRMRGVSFTASRGFVVQALTVLAAFAVALGTALGTGVSALAQTARITSIMPADRVIYPGDELKVRLVFMFDRSVQFQNPEVRYEISEFESGEVVERGAVPFNQTLASAGWAELKPDLPRGSNMTWYRASISFWDRDKEIPIADGPGGAAGGPGSLTSGSPGDQEGTWISFGVLPEAADYSEWSAAGIEPAVPSRKVMAFYYPWYGNPTVSRSWIHWPEGGHNPDAYDATGLPDVGAAHHPALGPYDSHDPRVIKQHLAWAEAAGIDVLIASWWGQGHFSDQALPRLLDAAAETSVRISLYYETIPGGSEQGVLSDLRYILSRYGDHPAFFKHDGEPVIFVYGRAMGEIPYDAWQRVIETIKAERPLKLIADSTDGRWAEIFDGLHMYNPVGPIVGGSDMRRLYESLTWAAKSRGKISSVTVIPGYDDSNIGRASVIVAPRRDGALYDELWELALASRPDWVIITSFNEWHEGSEIEPSVEYGDYYLRRTASWAARFKTAPERTLWVERSSMPIVVVPGREYPISISTVRTGDISVGPIGVQWNLPDGWTLRAPEQKDGGPEGKAAGESRATITARLIVPEDAAPGKYPLAITLSWRGYDLKLPGAVTVVNAADVPFEGVGVWTDLGAENQSYGLVQRDHPDGMTAPVVVDGVEARRTAPGVTPHKYIYFDVADTFLFDSDGTAVEIGIEFLDDRAGTFRLHYDSANPFGGPFAGAYTDGPVITMRGTGEWQTATVQVPDARFANRQNGATDFRFAVGTSDLTFRRVWVRLLEQDAP